MSELLRIALTNAATVTLVALGVWSIHGLVRRPEVLHGLWALVLLRLVTPPVLELGIVPRGLAEPRLALATTTEPDTFQGSGGGAPLTPSEAAGLENRRPPPEAPAVAEPAAQKRRLARPSDRLVERTAGGALLLGVACVSLLAAARSRRFWRCLAPAREAPAALRRRVTELSAAVGLRRAPPVALVGAPISPTLWRHRGTLLLLLPRTLLPRLKPRELDALIVHELAHVRRRDPWMRYLELVATALFWWHPVAWWARRSLRRAEERCCDEWVIRILPDAARPYAEALVKTLELLSGGAAPQPASATAAGELRDLETRMETIMKNRLRPRLSAPSRVLLALGATAMLAIFPTVVETAPPAVAVAARIAPRPGPTGLKVPDPSHPPAEPAAPSPPDEALAAQPPQPPLPESPVAREGGHELELLEARYAEQLRDLERQAVKLQEQMRRLEIHKMTLRKELESTVMRRHVEELRARAAELAARGEGEAAEQLELEARMAQRHRELEEERSRLELRQIEEQLDLDLELRRRQIQLEELELETERMSLELHALEEDRRLGESRHDELAVAHLDAEIQRLESARDLSAAEHHHRMRRLQVDREIGRIEEEIRRAVAEGRRDGAARLRQRLGELLAEVGALEGEALERRHAAATRQLELELEARQRAIQQLEQRLPEEPRHTVP